MKRIVIDLDKTITLGDTNDYAAVSPNKPVIDRLREYQQDGFEIVIATSRNMRTHQNSFGKIIAKTVPGIIDWLRMHEIPFDEIWVGKPWCGTEGFYVDDRAIRPDEFASLDYSEIQALIGDTADDA